MSIPVISVDIGPEKIIFNATSEGYQAFTHNIMDRAKSALANRQSAMTKIIQLEDIWRTTENFFAKTVLQGELVPDQLKDVSGHIINVRTHANEFFVSLYKKLASLIEAAQQENNEPSSVIVPSVITEPVPPRIVIDWSALANNRKVRWGIAGAVIGGAFAWFMSSKHPRRIEKRK